MIQSHLFDGYRAGLFGMWGRVTQHDELRVSHCGYGPDDVYVRERGAKTERGRPLTSRERRGHCVFTIAGIRVPLLA